MLRSKFSIKNEELEKLDAGVSDMLREFATLSGGSGGEGPWLVRRELRP